MGVIRGRPKYPSDLAVEDMGGTSDTAGQTHLEGRLGASRLRFPKRKFFDGTRSGHPRVCDDLDGAQDRRAHDSCGRFFSLAIINFGQAQVLLCWWQVNHVLAPIAATLLLSVLVLHGIDLHSRHTAGGCRVGNALASIPCADRPNTGTGLLLREATPRHWLRDAIYKVGCRENLVRAAGDQRYAFAIIVETVLGPQSAAL